MNGNGGPIGYVYNQLKRLLTKQPDSLGPPATYFGLVGNPSEYVISGVTIPTFTPSRLTPLGAATTRVTGIHTLSPVYENIKRRAILPINDKLRINAQQILDEPVRKYLLSDNPDFSKFLASVDPNVRGNLAGRFLSHLFTRTPESERAIIGRLPFNDALRDALFLEFIFHLYPGVADIAADQLANEYYKIFGPIVSQMSPEQKRLLAEKYVDMFGVSDEDREKAISQILISPRRTTIAAVIASGGYSVDSLKDFLTGKVDDKQLSSIMRKLIGGEGGEHVRPLYARPKEDRSLIAQAHSVAPTRIRPVIGEQTITNSPGALLKFFDMSIKDIRNILSGASEVGKLELVHGELASTTELIARLTEDRPLTPDEKSRFDEVITHLYDKFGKNLPGISPELPASGRLGVYSWGTRQMKTVGKLPIFFHELTHGLMRLATRNPPLYSYHTSVIEEIAAEAFGLAATAYVQGKEDYPFVALARSAGLLPGGAERATSFFDWVVEKVVPYIESSGPSRSAMGDSIISIYRQAGQSGLGPVRQTNNLTSPLIRKLARPFVPNVDELEKADSLSRTANKNPAK